MDGAVGGAWPADALQHQETVHVLAAFSRETLEAAVHGRGAANTCCSLQEPQQARGYQQVVASHV